MGVNEHQFNAIVWAVWDQGTRRLVGERPNGETIEDQNERRWRQDALRPEPCPHWADYRARAVPIVTAAARELFAGQPDDEALEQLFRQLQTQPWVGMQTIRRVAQHADLDVIIEASVWPWLEQKYAAEQPLSQPDAAAAQAQAADAEQSAQTPAQPAERTIPCVHDYRAQITPLAKLAYQLHEVGTQISYFATRQSGAEMAALDTASVNALTSCATILVNHSTYVRTCAVQLRKTALQTDQIAQRHTQLAPDPAGELEHQWWSDLTTRPITSVVRAEVTAVSSAGGIAVVLAHLADESDVLLTELGDAFESVGWNRALVEGAAHVGPTLRAVSQRFSAGDDRGGDQQSERGQPGLER